jgi:polysaccharide pyruvyl transferase WcaK-like protein
MRGTLGLETPPTVLQRTAAASDGPLPSGGRSQATTGHRKHTTRIGLLGLFGCGNSGNDGSLEAMLAFVRQTSPDAEITCICAASRGASDRIARDLHVATIPLGVPPPERGLLQRLDQLSLSLPRRMASLVHAFRHARRLDVLIIPGTGILDDFGGRPFGMPLTLLTWCLAARLGGARIAFVSIGAGPIEHPVSRWLMRSAVGLAYYRSYRDAISKTFMESIGFDTRNDAVYPDLAFKLPSPSSSRGQRPDRRLVVGVGVMTYLGWRNRAASGAAIYQAYLEKLTAFVLWLLDQGHPVSILMGDAADQRAVNDLLASIGAARPGLPKDRLAFDPIISLHDLMRQIAGTDVVVATRYHNVVCALKMGRPTVSIGYADKNDVLMAEMGLRGFCQHIERLDLDLLKDQCTQVLSGKQYYEQAISETTFAYRDKLRCQELLLNSTFFDLHPRERTILE